MIDSVNVCFSMNSDRKKRIVVNMDILKSIRKSLTKEYTVQKCAEEAEISYTCAQGLIRKIGNGASDEQILGTKKGRPTIQNSELHLKLRNMLSRDPTHILQSMKDDLQEGNIETSISTIHRAIKNMKYSRKKLVKIPEERNSSRIIDTRLTFCRDVNNIPNDHLVYLDETGFNLHLTRGFGYSPINSKCFVTVPANRNRNISLLLAINSAGIVEYVIKEGSFNGDDLCAFIRQKLQPTFIGNPNYVLVMDNCRFHHRADVKQTLTDLNINSLYLPAYSPQLNPIEEYFSHLKARYTSIRPISKNKEEVKNRIVDLLTNEDISFNGWYKHMRQWVDRGMSRQIFE